jgi:glycosyltransferase involved in cell wall biosynthesis
VPTSSRRPCTLWRARLLASSSTPDVGIVMPVYVQVHEYLREALETILAQSYRNFRLVVIGDGAPSDVLEVVREVTRGDSRVEVVANTQNEGVSRALNMGFSHLEKFESIEYLTWISSDNVYHPTFLEKLRHALSDAPAGVGLAYSCFRTIGPSGDVKPLDDPAAFRAFQSQPKSRLIDAGFVGVSFMYKKKYAMLVGGYRMEPVEDFDYWLRLAEVCDIQYVPEDLMDYRENAPLSISKSIHSSRAGHRRWRHAFNLARQEARMRRAITNQATVIVALRRGTKRAVENLELLLDQPWSDYLVWIVDLGAEPALLAALREVDDPRISYRRAAGDEMAAFRRLLRDVQTPFTLLSRDAQFPPNLDPSQACNKRWWSSPVGELDRTGDLQARLAAHRLILLTPIVLAYQVYRFLGARIVARIRAARARLGSVRSRLSVLKARLSRFWRFTAHERRQSSKREAIFQKAYEDNFWGNEYSLSGPGSTLESTERLRAFLPRFVADVGAESLLDIPCGDFQWMKSVALGAKYYGADIVRPLIEKNRSAFGDRGEFLNLDLLKDRLPAVDIILCRDCLVHMSFREIRKALRNIKKAAPRFLMTTTFPDFGANFDVVTPDWRPINLQAPPFNFAEPLTQIQDFADSQTDHIGKCLAVWRVQDLPQL